MINSLKEAPVIKIGKMIFWDTNVGYSNAPASSSTNVGQPSTSRPPVYRMQSHGSRRWRRISGQLRENGELKLYSDADNSKFVAVKGRGSVSRDRAKIHELWNPMYKAWFPEGEDDPAVTVLRVDVSEAQYWEASASRLVRGAKYLAAAVTGGKVDLGETGKVTL